VSVTHVSPGQPVSLSVLDGVGAVTLDIPPGGHRGTTLVVIPYDAVPGEVPGGPSEAESALGAPVVSVGPAYWVGPSAGSSLSIPVREKAANGLDYRFERWNGSDWLPVAGGAAIRGGFAAGIIPGGGWYRLAAGSAPEIRDSAGSAELLGNAPNPFNPQTSIRFRISPTAAGESVKLTILNVRGQLVRTLLDRPLGAGDHSVTWNGEDDSGHPVATGIYLYRLEVAGTSLTRKMLLLR
jgi:hypothetical protein